MFIRRPPSKLYIAGIKWIFSVKQSQPTRYSITMVIVLGVDENLTSQD